jgi:pimeloyl-ACP methyl ester carboxylesterase
VLWLHGLGSSGEDWGPQAAAFGERYRLLLVDLPGHYRSALPPGPLTVEGMAAEAARLLEGLNAPAAHVVGLSLGACVGLALALDWPARVRSLTVVNGFARWRPATPAAAARGLLRLALLGVAPMRVVAGLVARGLFPAPEQADLYREAVRSLGRTRRRAYLGSLLALTAFDARERVGAIRCPTLVVTGLEDRTVARDDQEALARAIPGARSALVPGGGHAPHYDRAETFNRVVLDFLAEVDAGVSGAPAEGRGRARSGRGRSGRRPEP